MTKTAKWLTASGAVILGLALIIIVGAWRLGLLPLLFSPPPAAVGTTPNAIKDSSPAPVSTGQQPQQPSPAVTHTPPSAPGNTTLNNTGSSAGLPENGAQLTKDQLQQQIDDYYTAKLNNLAESYENQLNALVGEAMSEYQADKQQGNNAAIFALAGKYYSEGSALEKQCDAQFYSLLDEYKAQLRKNNLSLDTANRDQQEYESAKAAREKELLSEATKIF